ncbi:MAG: lipopolysaccharide biosynthesis protein [Fibrobacteraceae bacterium]|nr:lipopolysaccharide biosynthesis protein [Fibrobacteraceae bacterium]
MEQKENLSLFELLLKVLNNSLRHKALFLSIVLLPTLAMFIVVMWVMKPVFAAEAIVTPPSGKSSIGSSLGKMLENVSGLSSVSSLLGSEDQATNIVWTFFNSWQLHQETIEKFGIREHYEFDGKYQADLLKIFRKNLTLEYNDENMFYLRFEDEDYKLAAQILQFILTKSDSMYNAYNTNQAKQSRIYMDARLKEVEHNLDSLEKVFTKFQAENNLYDPEIQLESTVKYLGTLQSERDALVQEISYEKMQRGDQTKRYEELSSRLKSLDASIAEAIKGKRNKMGVLALSKTPDLTAQYLKIESELKIQQTIYKFLRQQSEQLRLDEVNKPTNLVVLQPPWENDKKVRPGRSVILAFTMLLSGLFAVVICNFIEFMKKLPSDSSISRELGNLKLLLKKH